MTGAHTYGAYGETATLGHVARVAYAGEVMESDTGWYVLGNRLYSPVLHRFLGPDPESPFHDGGFNRYAYCSGDPISRIDPTGNAWTDWLMAGLAVGLSVLGTVFSAGALAGTLPAAGGFAAAVTAPGFVATATAATLDVISTAASIGSLASMATKNQTANSIFGWIGMGAGLGSGAATVTAAKQGAFGMARGAAQSRVAARRASTASSVSSSAASSAGARTASSTSTSTSKLGRAASAVSVGRAGLAATAPIQRRHSTGSLVTTGANTRLPPWRAHSTTSVDDARAPIDTGPRRSQQAFQNPHARRGSRSGELPTSDPAGPVWADLTVGVKVAATDETTLTKEQIRRRLSEDGTHFVVSGHGFLDETAMQALNLTSLVSDHLLPVRAGP